jgi:CubicO group peptidase (beta-lactamase class C family)
MKHEQRRAIEMTPASLADRLGAAISEGRVAGASLAVWHAGQLRRVSCGLVNAPCGIGADDDSVFQIGSISKVFTATLLLMLAEEGLIELDDPVARHLPDFRIAGASPPEALTIRSLIDYTSGIAGDFFADFGPGTEALARYVEACADLPLLFPPGTMRGYSSTAFCVAGRVAEVVTGESFEAALARRLLRPLGMERFGFFTHDIARFRTAIGHVPHAEGFTAAEVLRLPHAMSASGSSLTTTATDLLRFGLLHLREGRTESGVPLLSPKACRAMIAPTRHLPPGDAPVRIGWSSAPLGDGELICASGETIHQNAFLGFSPAHDLVLAILANTSGGATRLLESIGCELIAELTGARLTLPAPTPAAAQDGVALAPYAGEYTNHTRMAVTPASGALAMSIRAQDPAGGAEIEQALRLTPVGEHRFVAGLPEHPAAVFEFLFMDGPEAPASHVASGGRVFARCDADGRTRYR